MRSNNNQFHRVSTFCNTVRKKFQHVSSFCNIVHSKLNRVTTFCVSTLSSKRHGVSAFCNIVHKISSSIFPLFIVYHFYRVATSSRQHFTQQVLKSLYLLQYSAQQVIDFTPFAKLCLTCLNSFHCTITFQQKH